MPNVIQLFRCLGLAVLVVTVGGCPAGQGGNGNGQEMRVNLPLAGVVAPVEVQAGEVTTFRQTFHLPNLMGPLESVSIDMAATLESIAVTMLDDAPPKDSIAAQSAESMVTYRVGTMAEADTVCETGVAYGPFRVALDAQDQPTSVDPPSAALTSTSVEVINSGQFSICVVCTSPRRAMVAVNSLAVDVAMQSASGDCEPVTDFSGMWRSVYSCTSTCDPNGFGGDFTVTITQQGNRASYTDDDETYSGTVCGNVWTFSLQPGPAFTETGTLRLNSDGSASRVSHYRDSAAPFCEGDCEDTFTRVGSSTEDHVCGNGVVETGEACDDGNTAAGDGCNACQLETGDCVPFGGACTDDADCCDDFPCVEGICI